jgi:hypothetical protein
MLKEAGHAVAIGQTPLMDCWLASKLTSEQASKKPTIC